MAAHGDEASFTLNEAGASTAKWKTRYKGWQCIPIQHQQLDPEHQIISQDSVAAFTKAGRGLRPSPPKQPRERILDGDLILRECQESSPVDVYGAKLRSKNIVDVELEDCRFFASLAHLDVSDNHLQLHKLAFFPFVRSLALQCNGLEEVTVPEGGFGKLEVLDLSFNCLQPHTLLALSAISQLRELDLSQNNMGSVPADWAGFRKLTRLNLAKNRLRGDEALEALSTIPNLSDLDVEANGFDSLGPLIRAGMDAAECKETGGYRGPFCTLHRLNFARQEGLETVGGLEMILDLPAFKDLDISGTTAVKSKASAAELHELRKMYDEAEVELFVGHVPLFPVPQPKMAAAYTKAAPNMLEVSAKLTQNEWATNPELWDILGSDDDEDEARSGGHAHHGAASAKITDEDLPPLQYDLDEDGLYRTPADMRAAYNQLRKALDRPEEYWATDPASQHRRRRARQRGALAPKQPGAGRPASHGYSQALVGAVGGAGSGLRNASRQNTQSANNSGNRMASMEQMLEAMRDRVGKVEEHLAGTTATLARPGFA